ncbi:type VII secretion protein EccB [Streptomyces aidingensis]|uniref:Type VII secretion protein EccB n=1 Tax=Streptomyces aidingensis TaxID=910347 RepID=A0A1I1PIV0_9ACTN|nr:type VII secretion protein EccB [Streptomyces aidingensis]SFD09642.1 type VII secretion protein EccB [Streptomyces aidingensis]
MATTREQAEAYAYANRRMSTGLLRGADEARLDPRRRLNRALGAGVAVGILIMAGFGIAGWLGGGRGPGLPTDGAVVVGDSGDPYVVRDGTVHPALNLASALLVGGGEPTKVRRATLDEAPRGLPVGIPGAPDALPGADDLLHTPWTLCATPAETGGPPAETALYVSVPEAAATDGATVLAETEDGRLWLLAEGRRYALEPAIRDLLGLPADPVPLPLRIIATVPEGPEITVPAPAPGTGRAPEAGRLPFDAAVGDLARTGDTGAGPRYFQVRSDGLLRITELVHTLLARDAERLHEISPQQAGAAGRASAAGPGDRAWPEAVPEAQDPERNQPVCISTPPGSRPGDTPWRATVHLPPAMPDPAGIVPVAAGSGEPLGLLDRIYIPAGSGALVRATASAGAAGTHTLVTDSGIAYPLASPDTARLLGYDPARTPAMPRGYVGLLPAGPVLDPETAAQERAGGDR